MVVHGTTDLGLGRPVQPFGPASWANLSQAADGQDATFARAPWTEGAGIVLDLGLDVDVGRLALRWASTSSARLGAFLLQGSRDGLAFVNLRDPVGFAAHAASVPQEDAVTFPVARVRFVRLLMLGPAAGDDLLLCALRVYEALYAGSATVRAAPVSVKPGEPLRVFGVVRDRSGALLVGETVEARLLALDGTLLDAKSATTTSDGYETTFDAPPLTPGDYLAVVACPIPDVLLTPDEGVLTDDGVGLTATDLSFFEDFPVADGYALAAETLTLHPETVALGQGALVGEDDLTGRVLEVFAVLQGGNGTPPPGTPMAEGETLPIAQAPDLHFEEEVVITGGFLGG